MAQYEKHVFVCTYGKWCNKQGDASELVGQLKALVAAHDLKGVVRINQSGCLGQCGHGPMVVVYPDNHWYAGVHPADATEIFESDIVAGQIVEKLRFVAPPGDNKDTNTMSPDSPAS